MSEQNGKQHGKARLEDTVRVALVGVGNCANSLLQGVEYYKVGKDLAEAIWAHPNDTIKFADVPETGIKVSRGMTHDGLGKYISQVVTKAPGETSDVVGILRDTKTDVVVNYLPVGSESATKWYTEQVLEAGCALVNCMPVFISR